MYGWVDVCGGGGISGNTIAKHQTLYKGYRRTTKSPANLYLD